MRIRVKPQARQPYETTLVDFVIDHEIDAIEAGEIALTLCNGLEFIGGGGPMPFFEIERIDQPRRPVAGPSIGAK